VAAGQQQPGGIVDAGGMGVSGEVFQAAPVGVEGGRLAAGQERRDQIGRGQPSPG